MSNFKIAVLAIFSVSIVASVVMFALLKSPSSTSASDLLVWGTVPKEVFNEAYKNSSLQGNKSIKANYIEKDLSDFEQDFVEALAEGVGPDIVLLREDSIYQNLNKLLVIPYKNFTVRDFKDKFIEEGELFLAGDGVVAVPFMVDPLVMYWNRDIFSNNVISQPPKYWDEIYSIINKVTKKDNNANILQATVALGEWRNIVNAKEILSMLLLQAGTPITDYQDQKIVSVLNLPFGYPLPPSQSAVNFYIQFSNPTGATYTWNRSLPSSLNMFLSGDLAIYIGFASEIFGIQQKNSNLNFDVTYVPQIRDAPKKVVFGRMHAFSIVKQSKQVGGAFAVIDALTQPAPIKSIEAFTNLPPVRRDLLADKPTDAFRTVFYDSALISRSWIDPEPQESSNTFRDMIESITGGKSKLFEALSRAEDELSNQLK